MTYYRYIDGQRYERNLLDMAEQRAQDGAISLQDMQDVLRSAMDGNRITATERTTIAYIRDHYTLTEEAMQWLTDQQLFPTGFDAVVAPILNQEFGLAGIEWVISEEEVKKQWNNGMSRAFESALRSAILAFLSRGINQLSLQAVARQEHPEWPYDVELPEAEEYMKMRMREGKLYLIPLDHAATAFAAPVDGFNTDTFWVFGLEIPHYRHFRFVANVLRTADDQHSIGYASRNAPMDDLVQFIVKDHLGFKNLQVNIDAEEVNRQLAIMDGQNFGNALFFALHEGLYNAESSSSFNDHLRYEIWLEPEKIYADHAKVYAQNGRFTLIPLNLKEQMQTGALNLPFLANVTPDLSYQWNFALEMPDVTYVNLLITSNRDNDGSWNDGYVYAPFEQFGELVEDIIGRLFSLDGLRWKIDEAEVRRQQTDYGSDWPGFQALLMQALNTYFNDYLTADSLFNIVAQVHNLVITDFADQNALHEAVRAKIKEYMLTGTVGFIPASEDQFGDDFVAPANGESVETFWRFQLRLPELSDHIFFAILPRYPEDEQRPYCYGVN